MLSAYLAPNSYQITKEKSIEAIEINPNYIKALLKQAKIYEKVNKTHYALKDYEKVLRIDPTNEEAQASILRIPETYREQLHTKYSGLYRFPRRALLRCSCSSDRSSDHIYEV